MAEIEKLILRGRASRKAGFSVAIIESTEEAIRTAQAVSDSLSRLPERDRLVLLSELSGLSQDLARRVECLEADLATTREALRRARASGRVCRLYAQVDRFGGPRKARPRTPCP